MTERLPFDILPQPDETTCGPTCLHAVYRYYHDEVPLPRLIAEVPQLEDGGTLAVFLACHALRRGYRATIYTYNVQMFDPTWFTHSGVDLTGKLRAQLNAKADPKLGIATLAYLSFLEAGGIVKLEDLTLALIRKHLTRGSPILTGLSATYLHRSMREHGPRSVEDDIRGLPQGHFVVLCGYNHHTRSVLVADPLYPNPLATQHVYPADIERVLGAVLLGIITYDANLLILEPPPRRPTRKHRLEHSA